MYLRQNKNTAGKVNSVKLTEKEALQHVHPVSRQPAEPPAHALTVHYGSQNPDTAASRGTIQLLRKRVKGNGPAINQSDIFYDKKTGQYYGGMCIKNPDLRAIEFSEEEQTDYERAKGKDRSGHTLLLPESSDGRFIQNPVKSGQRTGSGGTFPLYKGCWVSSGERVSDPPSVRLYSEANMDHAGVLADTMTSPDKFQDFLSLGQGRGTHDGGFREAPLIKATEFDERSTVLMRYATDKSNQSALYQLGRHFARLKKTGADTGSHSEHLTDVYGEAIYKFLMEAAKNKKLFPKILEESDLTAAAGRFIPEMLNKLKGGGELTGETISDVFSALFGSKFKAGQSRKVFENKGLHTPLISGYDDVMKGWDQIQEQLEDKESKERLEVSYGGRTGNMTLESNTAEPKRQYDLIQSTFFWLPDEETQKNADAMSSFMINKYNKLKPGGIIRVVSLADDVPGFERNQYKKAADLAIAEVKKDKRFTDAKTIYLKKSGQAAQYETLLHDRGMNPEQDTGSHDLKYRRLLTKTRKPVAAGENGDLILQAKRPPESAPQPSPTLRKRSDGVYTGSPFPKAKPHIPDLGSLSSSLTVTKLGTG